MNTRWTAHRDKVWEPPAFSWVAEGMRMYKFKRRERKTRGERGKLEEQEEKLQLRRQC